MSLILFAHPFSSYCQKVLMALHENATPFIYRVLDNSEPISSEFAALWPLKRFPLLLDDGQPIAEATIIVEHLDLHHPGSVRFIPDDPKAALEVRFLDRVFDNYIQTPMQKIVADAMREAGSKDQAGVVDAHTMLETTYAWLEPRMATREWAAGSAFGLADCAAAPALFYADWVHPIGDGFRNLRAYRNRLNERPSFARAVDEARPFRAYFPPGAPDRD